jgi:hypothetical protein
MGYSLGFCGKVSLKERVKIPAVYSMTKKAERGNFLTWELG